MNFNSFDKMSFKGPLFYCLVAFSCLRTVQTSILAVDGNNETEVFFDSEVQFIQNIQGVVVEANPPDACSNITAPPPQPLNRSMNWFVLIGGGACSTHLKISHACEARYYAAVIYASYRDGDSIIPVYNLKYMCPNFTAVLVSDMAGFRIREKYLYNIDPGAFIRIYSNQGFSILTFLFLLAVVSGTFILVMLVFLIIRCIQQHRRQRRNRLSTQHLKQLETIKFKRGDPYDTCAICLEDYKEKDKLRILPCQHGYHCKCIDPWLTNNKRTCPVCKQRVNIPGVHIDDDDDDSSDTESRAETAPLIRSTARRNFYHGTFGDRPSAPVSGRSAIDRLQGSQESHSGETTSRDAPSDVLDETSEEDVVTVRASSSAPNILTLQPSDQVTSGSSSEACRSEQSQKAAAQSKKPNAVVKVRDDGESSTSGSSSSSHQKPKKDKKHSKTYVV